MRHKYLAFGAVCAVALIAANLSAAILLTEDFSYPDGALVGNGTWVNHSGTPGTLLVASGAAVVTENSGSEDANVSFAVQSSGVLTASFDMVVTAPGAMTGTGFEYFAHFYPADDGFNYRARADIVAPNAGAGDYTIGIATTSSTAEITLPTNFVFGTVVPVSIAFDLSGGTASLTAGGNTVNTSVVSMGDVIDAFALRQANSTSDETLTIDNLVISHEPVPEPTSIFLAVVSILGTLIMGRRYA